MSMKERACSHCIDGWIFVAPSFSLQFPEIHRGGAKNSVYPCQNCFEGTEKAYNPTYTAGAERLEWRRRELAKKASK